MFVFDVVIVVFLQWRLSIARDCGQRRHRRRGHRCRRRRNIVLVKIWSLIVAAEVNG